MKQILTDFSLGSYVGLVVEANGDETAYLNELINIIIDNVTYRLDETALEEEAARAEQDLREGLKRGKKPIGAFCYVNGITEEELPDYCKANLVRTALENLTIESIAEIEGIEVTPTDIETYKQEYRDQYVRTLLAEPDFGDKELAEAILVKRVLHFLKDNNTWKRDPSNG